MPEGNFVPQVGDLSTPLSQALITSPEELVACASEIDVAVIGSGAAGVAAALMLAERGRTVAILEAGPLVLLQHAKWLPFRTGSTRIAEMERAITFPIFWETPDGSTTAEPSGKGWSLVGGRTVFWGGCIPRFEEHEFADWPITLADLKEDYTWAENSLYLSGPGTGRPSFFRSEAQDSLITRLCSAGFQARELPLAVDTLPTANGYVPRGFDSSVARLLRSERVVRPKQGAGILLVSESPAIRFEHHEGRVTALVIHDRRRQTDRRLTVKTVVLAAGTLQSVRLALASGLDVVDPLAGKYIGDHLYLRGALELAEPLGNASAYLFLPPTPEKPFQLQLQGGARDDWYDPIHTHPLMGPQHGGRYILFHAFGRATMQRENRLVLKPSSGQGAHHPLDGFRVCYRRSDEDEATISAMRTHIEKVASTLSARVVEFTALPPGSSLHEIGGLRMGGSPESGVTRPDGRFWRFTNLYSADASLWPSQGAANPTLTITAIARRVANAI